MCVVCEQLWMWLLLSVLDESMHWYERITVGEVVLCVTGSMMLMIAELARLVFCFVHGTCLFAIALYVAVRVLVKSDDYWILQG